nr:small heat shock protein [Magelona pitelkai]
MAIRPIDIERPFRRMRSWIDDPWADMKDPHRMFDQFFGQSLSNDDFVGPPVLFRGHYMRPRRLDKILEKYGNLSELHTTKDPEVFKALKQTGLAEVKCDDSQFSVMLDVTQFSPEEVEVKTNDNKLTIHAKHEEKEDEHGFISREFTRTYLLPKNVDPLTLTTKLTSDGVLNIAAPKKNALPPKERILPIKME